MSDQPPHQGEATCTFCEKPLDWTPAEIKPGAYYICLSCEKSALQDGVMVRVEEFFGEWPLFDSDGNEVHISLE